MKFRKIFAFILLKFFSSKLKINQIFQDYAKPTEIF